MNNCMKIMPYQIQKIVSLVAEHRNKAPYLLELLQIIIRVGDNHLPLKRNQSYVMKYLMQQRTEVAEMLDRTGEDRLVRLPDNFLFNMDCAIQGIW